MGRGRPPKPTVLKRLAGNPGKRTLNPNEPDPRRDDVAPSPPRHLSREAKREWRRVVPELHRLGLLTRIDTAALEAYCEAYATWVDATKRVREQGMVFNSPNGWPVQNPYLSIANQAAKEIHRWLVEFGMTPASRSRVSVERKDEKDPYEDLLSIWGPDDEQ
jgi:P27 family predicted phage terminase small subunit